MTSERPGHRIGWSGGASAGPARSDDHRAACMISPEARGRLGGSAGPRELALEPRHAQAGGGQVRALTRRVRYQVRDEVAAVPDQARRGDERQGGVNVVGPTMLGGEWSTDRPLTAALKEPRRDGIEQALGTQAPRPPQELAGGRVMATRRSDSAARSGSGPPSSCIRKASHAPSAARRTTSSSGLSSVSR